MSSISTKSRNPLLRAESLDELCAWRGVDFVRCAYVTILGRQPDLHGETYYLDRLRNGFSKLTLIAQMRQSSEGKRHDPGIAGLDKALRKHRNACRPLTGSLVRLLTGRAGDLFRERQSRMLSDIIAGLDDLSQQQSISDARHNALQSGVTENFRKLGSDITVLSESILRQQSNSEAAFHKRIGELQSEIEDRVGRLGSDIMDTERASTEMAVALGSKVEDLKFNLQATITEISELKSNAERVRGLMLKANRAASG